MSTLHIINKATGLASCLGMAAADDAILLIADGVYVAARPDTPARALYALATDIHARGLGTRLGAHIRLVDYDGFVDLVANHDQSVSWR